VHKIKKIIFILIVNIFMISNMFTVVFAYINPGDYKPSQVTTSEYQTAFSKAGVVLGAIRNVSVIVSVIALMVIGVKYMVGSVEEKAEYKKTMIPYIVGCVLVVSATTIVTFIYNAVKD
jgi:type IV secretory pathway VirB2 component (pilin)